MQDEGLCRRHAPTAIPSTEISYDGDPLSGEPGLLAAWPRTCEETDWCGDFVVRADLDMGRENLPKDTK
jgi:hypothetical protein